MARMRVDRIMQLVEARGFIRGASEVLPCTVSYAVVTCVCMVASMWQAGLCLSGRLLPSVLTGMIKAPAAVLNKDLFLI